MGRGEWSNHVIPYTCMHTFTTPHTHAQTHTHTHTHTHTMPHSPSTMYHHSYQVIHFICVGSLFRLQGKAEDHLTPPTHASSRLNCVEQLEFPWKHNTVGQLGVAVELLHVLEPLEVEGQDLGQLFDPQPLGCFLLAAALLTVILGVCTQCL